MILLEDAMGIRINVLTYDSLRDSLLAEAIRVEVVFWIVINIFRCGPLNYARRNWKTSRRPCHRRPRRPIPAACDVFVLSCTGTRLFLYL